MDEFVERPALAADSMDVPRSTLSYRLRRAEARLVGSYAESTVE